MRRPSRPPPGRAQNDQDSAVAPSRSAPLAGSPLIDSADCGAHGELAADLHGLPHVDDPLVADTGPGTCHAGRAPFQREAQIAVPFAEGGTRQVIAPFAFT